MFKQYRPPSSLPWNCKFLFLLCGYLLPFSIAYSQKSQSTFYQQAYKEQLRMLQGTIPANFKRAVFLTENAYQKGSLDYTAFCSEIASTGRQLKAMIATKGIGGYRTAGNWAAFTYMTEKSLFNNNLPFTYDFDDFMGKKDWQKMFVTKLMHTHKGNCHSLPYYYKILCEEIGASASLALAPNHIYIKHLDEHNQWSNVELTNGGFPRDQWIIKEMAITVEAIKKRSYMAPLSQKQSVALAMFDLACAYDAQFGKDSFTLMVASTALRYFPECIPLLQYKANCIDTFIKREKKKSKPNGSYLTAQIAAYNQLLAKIDQTGYKDMPPELYREWVKSVELEKSKQKTYQN